MVGVLVLPSAVEYRVYTSVHTSTSIVPRNKYIYTEEVRSPTEWYLSPPVHPIVTPSTDSIIVAQTKRICATEVSNCCLKYRQTKVGTGGGAVY